MQNSELCFMFVLCIGALHYAQGRSIGACDPIVAPENGYYDDKKVSKNTHGRSVTFLCNPGFILSDLALKTVTCGDDGSWGPLPTCEVDYGCDFEDRSPNFTCGYSNSKWTREYILEDYRRRKDYVASAKQSTGASLTSQSFTVGDQGACLSFYYRILENNAADFTVTQQLRSGSDPPATLFTANKVTTWKKIELDLVASAPITWKFEVSSHSANVELDFVRLKRTSCQSSSTTTTRPVAKVPRGCVSPPYRLNQVTLVAFLLEIVALYVLYP